jgi:carbon-monoxide dehydrogenase small subunit
MNIALTLNDAPVLAEVAPETTLLDWLREARGLMAAKPGCEIGRCGACAVLLDGRLVNACLVLAWQAEGAAIVTAEGLEALAEGRAARAALREESAFQCGYCAPGMSVALTAWLLAGGGEAEAALAGNLCRCTGYGGVLRAAARAKAG